MSTVISSKILGLNAMAYLPTGYDPTKAYPLILFSPGAGEIGTNAALLSAHGPFRYLKAGVDLGLPLIVIAIQNTNANPRPAEVQMYIKALKALYNISALILTGLSRSGQTFDWFVSNAEANLSQVSALVLFSSEGPVSDEPGIAGTWTPSWFVDKKVPYWFGIGTQDSFYNANKARYNALIAAGATAYWTEWAGVGHGDPVWSDGYNPAWINNSLKKSIYQWAAGFGAVVVPPVIIPPVKPPVVIPPKAVKEILVTYVDGSTQLIDSITIIYTVGQPVATT